MPALRRKRKLMTECKRWDNHDAYCKSTITPKSKLISECQRWDNYDACCKSIITPKSSQSQVNTSQPAAELDTSAQIHWDVTSGADISGCNSTTPFAQLLNSPSLLVDPSSFERMDPFLDASQANLETIFSPNLEHDVSQQKMTDYVDADKYDSTELPCLVADESDDGICGSNDFQTCSLLDFYGTDSISASPFDSSMGFNDVLNAAYRDCEPTNSGIMIDMAERYMILPFLERTVETSSIHHDNSIQEIIMNFDDPCLYLSIHEPEMSHCFGDLEEKECSDPLAGVTLPNLPEALPSTSPILLPRGTEQRKPVTLVLDLDETLVHSTLDYCSEADFSFPVILNMKQNTVYVRRRPFLQMFLERVAQLFEIVIFTASQSVYAAKILDILDPDQKIISQRIYRDSCIYSDGCYTKDLRILGVDLAKVVIIDNSPQVFRWQVNNGIPIKSWFDDPSDHALVQLLPFLESLVDADDVRPIIAEKFGDYVV